VEVHPWSPSELGSVLESAGIRAASCQDRSVQAGPKLDESRYWPGLPPLRGALGALLDGDLAARRHALVRTHVGASDALARGIWDLEAGSGGGFGHGLLAIGRVA